LLQEPCEASHSPQQQYQVAEINRPILKIATERPRHVAIQLQVKRGHSDPQVHDEPASTRSPLAFAPKPDATYLPLMGMAVFPEWVQSQKLVSELADKLGDTLNPSAADALLKLQLDTPTTERRRELAEKANEDLLSTEEFAEYETYAQLRALVAILQSKARLIRYPFK
jgi:hypothetical protein